MTRRHRQRPDARKPPNREPGRRILIVCEGAVTEREYFVAFRRWCKNPRVEIDFDGPAGVPWTLVGRARDRREAADSEASRAGDDFLRYDEVWCVFDVDEHPRVADARANAQTAGLRLAMSNPCFELWLLLHFADSPGMQHRQELQARLRARMPGVLYQGERPHAENPLWLLIQHLRRSPRWTMPTRRRPISLAKATRIGAVSVAAASCCSSVCAEGILSAAEPRIAWSSRLAGCRAESTCRCRALQPPRAVLQHDQQALAVLACNAH